MSLWDGDRHSGCYSGALIPVAYLQRWGGASAPPTHTQAAESLLCCNVTGGVTVTATAGCRHLLLPQETELRETPGFPGTV